jgi:deoxyribonuclease-4
LGVHVSISGKIFKSIDRAKAIGCTAMQIFSHNPRGWKVSPLLDDDVRIFKEKLNESKIHPLVVHTSYLINLASPDEDLYKRSIDSFKLDLERADMLGATFLVTHIGSSKDRDIQYGIKRASDALNSVLEDDKNRKIKILLENTAGSGSIIGYRLNQIKAITDSVKENHSLGLCFDTCHGFASGYDLRDMDSIEELIKEIDSLLGMDRLCLIHLNDSKGSLGSLIDRHEHIGKGKIGIKGFEMLINHQAMRDMPMILETPKKEEQDDVKNLSTVKGLRKPMDS